MELELITYTVIACEDLPISSHLGSLRTLGLSFEEIGQVMECGELVAKLAGERGWPDLRAMVAGLVRLCVCEESCEEEAGVIDPKGH